MSLPFVDGTMPAWWSALMTLLGASFAVTALGQPSGIPADSAPVPIRRLFTEQDSGIQQARRAVIRNAGEWQSIEDAIRRGRRPAVALPTVDFGRSMVILAAMGVQTTGGHAITIEGVYRGGGQLWVLVREVSPGPGCMTTQALTTPADAVGVPRSDDPLSFVEIKEKRGCR